MNEGAAPDARPGPLRWALTLVGCGILLFAWADAGLPGLARWLVALGGLAVILLAPAAARGHVTLVEIPKAGHAMLPEQPDQIAKAILTYLRR